jgi:hypothetical protein
MDGPRVECEVLEISQRNKKKDSANENKHGQIERG